MNQQGVEAKLQGDAARANGAIEQELFLPEEERLANRAAAEFCVPGDRLGSFLARKHPFYYDRDVVAFAKLLSRHPGLIVGQMQFRLKNYSYLTKYLVKVRSMVLPGAIVDGWGQTPSLQFTN